MFICDGCREKNFTNPASIGYSVGKCELCGRDKVCSEIPSYALVERVRATGRKKAGGKRG